MVTTDDRPATLYKFLDEDGTCFHGGKGRWHLPVKRPDGAWRPGAWRWVRGELKPCSHAIHFIEADQLLNWVAPLLCTAEAGGTLMRSEFPRPKWVSNAGRLLTIVEGWNERTMRLLAADYAEHVLGLWTAVYPDDDRPGKVLEAARKLARGEIPPRGIEAAEAAGEAALRKASLEVRLNAREVAGIVLRTVRSNLLLGLDYVVWRAQRVAAESAAFDARNNLRVMNATDAWITALEAERAWQIRRLFEYLNGGVS